MSVSDSRERATVTIENTRSRGPLGAIVRALGVRCEPREYRLDVGSCKIGAGKNADLVVAHDTVSRLHAELTLVPEGVEVRDLGSRNGTFYLGQRVDKITLALGSRIVLGLVELQIDADSADLLGDSDDPRQPTEYGDLHGQSLAMRRLFATLTRLEGSLASVLIQGESGTGKELIARAIHQRSRVAEGPLISINCGAMDRALARSELFGHRRGAFTGALEPHTGAFEAASDGTLFLDEIGDLPLEVQPALLRALEVRAIARVGESQERPVNVRVIAATHRDLEAEVRAGRFREDLYFRLMVVRLQVAPLRERLDDLDALIRLFATQAQLTALPEELHATFRRHSWPGNVRELKNAILAFAAVGSLPFTRSAELGELDSVLRRAIDVSKPYADQKERVLQTFARVYVAMLLESTGGNQSEAARVSGLERSYLGKLVGKFAKNPDKADAGDD